MVAKNIEHFNEVTGQVFACLYESFPLPLALRPKLLGIDEHDGGECSPEIAEALGVEPQSAEEVLFKHSVTWLIQAGYISAKPPSYGSYFFAEARLTAKGLEVLNAIPENLTKREPLGEQLAAATKSGAKELMRTITTEVLGVGVRLGLNAAGMGG